MNRNRYDLNDRHAYDGRPVKTKALSPRSQPDIRSRGGKGRTGSNARVNPVNGAESTDTASVRRPQLNTNANRRMGGSSTNYRPKAEDLVGRDVIAEFANPTAPYMAPMSNRKIERITPTGNRKADRKARRNAADKTKAESVAEGLRQNAAMEHNQRITYGIPYETPIREW